MEHRLVVYFGACRPERGEGKTLSFASLRMTGRTRCLLNSNRTMRLAMIGLGKMGGNMTERLLRNGHQVVAFDRAAEVVDKYAKLGATPAKDLGAVLAALQSPKIVWIMVPAGRV